MASTDSSGQNIGQLMRQGVTLTTREVLAIVHEICRDAAAAVPGAVDDVWIRDTGELLIARSDQIAAPLDPRTGVAALLEEMLPPGGLDDPDRQVTAALRGLPARLRATTEGAGPRDRRDLMSILSWHLNADPREVVRRLAERVFHPQTPAAGAVLDDIDDFPLGAEPAPVAVAPASPARRRARTSIALAIVGLAVLFVTIGSASYWFWRDGARAAVEQNAAPPASDVVLLSEPPAPRRAKSAAAASPQAAEGARPLRLEVGDGAFSPAFAATGRELFFHAGRANGRLLVASLDDAGGVSRVSAVRDDGGRDYHPRISPDGRWIAFDSDRDGERGVYVANRDGGAVERVSGPGYAAVPSWSPDMKWLAFIRGERDRPRVWNLWLRDVGTGALRRHTSFRSGQVWGASWFPGAKAIAYSHDDRLIISHLDGRDDIVIESPLRARLVRTPAVSPDGTAVVFQVFKDGVWLLDVNTRTTRRILDDPTAEEFAWSPDGERIAYHSRRDGAWNIWVMNVTEPR